MGLSLAIIGVLAFLIIWAIAIYNGLVKARTMVEEGWSGIDVQLKRRANLIPNLVETVKGYLSHEKSLLSDITELRSQSLAASDVAQKAIIEGRLSRSSAGLFAVAENYPDLKANQNFQHLQEQLADIENQVQMARRYYNGTVRNLNIKIDAFPSNLVAGLFAFGKAPFFEIDDPAARSVPQVAFK
jgi:LemA protein